MNAEKHLQNCFTFLNFFQVTREDHGLWMCLINDNKNFDSVKQFVSVEVGVIPDTGVSIEAGNMWDADTETRVEVVEGDNIALSCYARHGFPPSLVSWEHDITNDTSLRYRSIPNSKSNMHQDY